MTGRLLPGPESGLPDAYKCRISADVVDYLNALRQFHGLSLRQVASRAQRSVEQTSQFFNGKLAKVTSEQAKRFGAALGLNANQLDGLEKVLRSVAGSSPRSLVDVASFLPPVSEVFVGRDAEVDQVCRYIESCERAGKPAIVSLEGQAGIGKTEIAKQSAHRLLHTGRYDQEFFVDMHGYDHGHEADRPPSAPEETLAELLIRLGEPKKMVNRLSMTRKMERFRKRLGGMRVLLVLDNCVDEYQAIPILPHVDSCAVVMTSRHQAERHRRWGHLQVRQLGREAAMALLAAYDPRNLVDAEPEVAIHIAEQTCKGLPSLLQAVATQLADSQRADWTLTDHADRLDELHERYGRDMDARAALEGSYRRLNPTAQWVFRIMGLHPGAGFTAHQAAAMADQRLDDIQRVLAQLVKDHMLRAPQPGRFAYHDVYAAFSQRLRTDIDKREVRVAATDRLHRSLLHTARLALKHVAPREVDGLSNTTAEAWEAPTFTDAADARRWLDLERSVLIDAAGSAGGIKLAARLSPLLHPYLDQGGHWADAQRLHLRASEVDDEVAKGFALHRLADVNGQLGLFDDAERSCVRALNIAMSQGDQELVGRRLGSLGFLYRRMGQFTDALVRHEEALELAQQIGHLHNEALARHSLGVVLGRLGRYGDGLEHLEKARRLHRELGDWPNLAYATGSLGIIYSRQNKMGQALECHREALRYFRSQDNIDGIGHARHNLANVHRDTGHIPRALVLYQRAMKAFDVTGNRADCAEVLNDHGFALHAHGRSDAALDMHYEARELAEGVKDHYQIGRAHDGIAHVRRSAGRDDEAERSWQMALDIFSKIGVPESQTVARHLTHSDGESTDHVAVLCCLAPD